MEDVCLFAHFDKDDKVDDYVLRYLGELKDINFSIVFISTARLSPGDIARVGAVCRDVIVRENDGLDFGSWAAGFRKHGGAIKGRLLLANDSVYGPIRGLRAAFETLTAKPADFYGMVESMEITPHLQSWFVLLEPRVVRHGIFAQIMAQPFETMAKGQIIARGEVALSRRLMAAGFRYAALHRVDCPALALPRHSMNPMLLFWRELLFEYGIPFLKIELLRDNPLGVEDAGTIVKSLEPAETVWSGLIAAHLARTRRVRVPQRPFAARLHYALIRKQYRLARAKRPLAGLWNRIVLEVVAIPRAARRVVHALLRPPSRD